MISGGGRILGNFWERHCAIEVTLCNGNMLWIDNGWLGGDDNIFAPGEIPSGYKREFWYGDIKTRSYRRNVPE